MSERITGAPWALAEMVEDSLVAFAEQAIAGDVNTRPALSAEAVVNPCVVAYCSQDGNAAEPAYFNGSRAFVAALHIRTPAANQTLDGSVIATARQWHAGVFSVVFAACAVKFTPPELPYILLAGAVNEHRHPGVRFKQVHIGDRTRSVDEANNIIESVLQVTGVAIATGEAG